MDIESVPLHPMYCLCVLGMPRSYQVKTNHEQTKRIDNQIESECIPYTPHCIPMEACVCRVSRPHQLTQSAVQLRQDHISRHNDTNRADAKPYQDRPVACQYNVWHLECLVQIKPMRNNKQTLHINSPSNRMQIHMKSVPLHPKTKDLQCGMPRAQTEHAT